MTSEEAEGVRRGLLALRQNVVLLRDPADPNNFYPVSLPAGLRMRHGVACHAGLPVYYTRC